MVPGTPRASPPFWFCFSDLSDPLKSAWSSSHHFCYTPLSLCNLSFKTATVTPSSGSLMSVPYGSAPNHTPDSEICGDLRLQPTLGHFLFPRLLPQMWSGLFNSPSHCLLLLLLTACWELILLTRGVGIFTGQWHLLLFPLWLRVLWTMLNKYDRLFLPFRYWLID